MKILNILIPGVLACMATAAHAQALPTAKRLADLQVGATFSVANSNYTNSTDNPGITNDVFNLAQPTGASTTWFGYGAYADFDVRYHYGLEATFHQIKGSDPNLYERTFEIGPRFIFPQKRFVPYAKALYGRGIFNFAAINSAGQSVELANIGYNVLTAGGGLDLRLRPGLNIRVFDYEYQRWLNFPPNKLSPQVLSFGVAYHFHGPLGRSR